MQRGGKLSPQKCTNGPEVGRLLNEKARLLLRRGTLHQAVGMVGVCCGMLPLFFITTAGFMELCKLQGLP